MQKCFGSAVDTMQKVSLEVSTTALQQAYLAIVVPPETRSATRVPKPHVLRVMQLTRLVPIFGEHGSRLLCLLYLACPELPLCCLTVDEPAVQPS